VDTRGLDTWRRVDDDECRQAATVLEIIGRRWSSGILLAMVRGAERFTDITATVRGLSARMLSLRLRELEQAGLIDRVVLPTMPVSIRYQLTAQGRDLLASLHPVASYAGRWVTTPAPARSAEPDEGEASRAPQRPGKRTADQ
jgi:DNA-binding HxlR family transcriptional regulator